MLESLSRRCRRAAGLTLVELAVVLSLLAATATVAMPWFADQLARHRLRATAEALVGDLQEARFAAAQRGATMHLTFSTGTAWCWTLASSADCDCRIVQACRTRHVDGAEHRGVQLVSAQTASFSATGSGQGLAELRSPRGHALRVEVGALGRARLCSPEGSDPRYPAC
jgi:type IV fimbrial biogenesis protein FimT